MGKKKKNNKQKTENQVNKMRKQTERKGCVKSKLNKNKNNNRVDWTFFN